MIREKLDVVTSVEIGCTTAAEVAADVDASKDYVKRLLKKAYEEGRLHREKDGASWQYYPLKKQEIEPESEAEEPEYTYTWVTSDSDESTRIGITSKIMQHEREIQRLVQKLNQCVGL
ncbi:MAG: hypothetical protein ACPGWS_08770 [Solirubrobacterales bacterium]